MMNFKYLTHLEVVVVQVKLVIDKESQAFSADSEVKFQYQILEVELV